MSTIVSWGSTFKPEDIDTAPETSGDFTYYEGELPMNGVYGWNVGSMKKETSSQGNPMLVIRWENDGEKKGPNGESYKGAPWWDHPTLTKASLWKIHQLCLALGVSSDDYINNTKADNDGNVTSIGQLKVADMHVRAAVRRARAADGTGSLQLEFGRYLPTLEAAAEANADAPNGKKSKKGKKSAKDAKDEAHF
jgi:hypothetical protein